MVDKEDLIRSLRGRQFESYIVDYRNMRIEGYGDWHGRVQDADALVRGEFSTLFPNQMKATEKPMIQNLGEVMVRDVSRLVADSIPTVRSQSKSESDASKRRKDIRESIAQTYWVENEGDLLVPLWTMDLVISGAAFAVMWIDEGQYPHFDRVDPRNCYPDIYNGKLRDLLVLRRMKKREAARLYPSLGMVDPTDNTEVEVYDYYSDDIVVKALGLVNKGQVSTDQVEIMEAWEPEIGCPPVAFAQLPSHDGAFRGMLDQLGPSIMAKNKIARLMTQYADQQVSSPFVGKGVINPQDKPGPNTFYQLDPNIPDAQLGRVMPAGGSPQLFALMQLLDSEQRGQIAYPEARQGDVRQSIASAAFVASSQGQLTSVVREVQTYLAKMRERLTENCFKLDEKHLNYKKPITAFIPAGRETSYMPEDAIEGLYRVQVLYGAGAGLDRLNADVRLLQLYGAGLIDAETARENLEFVHDPAAVEDRFEREQVGKALMQKFVADPAAPFDLVLEVFGIMTEGKSFAEAIKIVREKAAKAAEQQVQAPQVPGQPTQVPEQAIEKGATAPEQLGGAGEVQFNPPPLEQIFVGS